MTEIITSDVEEDVKRLATESFQYLEPICQECWDAGADDPLGLRSGVNTRYSKKLNDLAEDIIEHHDEADMMWHQDIRQELVERFDQERDRQFEQTDVVVENKLECYYCYERKQNESDNGEVPIRLSVTDGKSEHLFGRDESEWL